MTSKKPTADMFVDLNEDEQTKEQETNTTEEENILHDDVANVIKLPSQGKLGYPEEVTYRDILVEDEEILSTATKDTYSKVLNRVIKSILNDPPFYEQMSVHDRDFLLIWLWANNYDPIKKLMVTCGSCGHKDEHSFDLRSVEVNDIKENFVPRLKVPLSTGDEIFVSMTTVADEVFAEEYTKKNPDVSYQYILYARSIDIGNVLKFDDKLDWIRKNVKSKEFGYVKNYHNYFKFGVEPVTDYTCSACGEVTQDTIPFQAEDILMPTVQSDFEQFLSTQ